MWMLYMQGISQSQGHQPDLLGKRTDSQSTPASQSSSITWFEFLPVIW